MRTYKHRIPYSEYRKRKRAFKKAQEQRRAQEAEEKQKQDLAWAEQGQRLIRAKQKHPVAYFFGNTDDQQEIFGRISFTNRLFGLGARTANNPTGHTGFLGHLVTVLFLVAFFPLMLLSHIHQLPVLQIVAFIAMGIEYKRYQRGIAFKHESKVVLGALNVLGWIFFLTALRSR